MDKGYADTVRLLLTVAPEVFANDIFAMKGGTAINLFVQGMPRLSVDIDVVFLPRQMRRDEAVAAIDAELAAIARRLASLGLRARRLHGAAVGDTKLIVENDTSQVKIEVNTVFRGTVLPVERRPLNARTGDLFGVEFDAPILARDELYARQAGGSTRPAAPTRRFRRLAALRIGRPDRRHGRVLCGLPCGPQLAAA